jgi:acetyl-CoA carboxylase carboxyl transferase subunit beta
MCLLDWFRNRQKPEIVAQTQQEKEASDDLWTKCESCGSIAYTKELQANDMKCPECGCQIPLNP